MVQPCAHAPRAQLRSSEVDTAEAPQTQEETGTTAEVHTQAYSPLAGKQQLMWPASSQARPPEACHDPTDAHTGPAQPDIAWRSHAHRPRTQAAHVESRRLRERPEREDAAQRACRSAQRRLLSCGSGPYTQPILKRRDSIQKNFQAHRQPRLPAQHCWSARSCAAALPACTHTGTPCARSLLPSDEMRLTSCVPALLGHDIMAHAHAPVHPSKRHAAC